MVQVPLFQEALQGGALPAFRGGGVAPLRSATGGQIQQLGRAVQIAGTSAANIADVLQDDLDTARTKEAYALWNDENRLALHGANPADLGYLNKKGKAATGDARINTQNRIAGNAETFSKSLDNEDQRAMFEIAVQARTSQINQQLDVHEARAIQVFGIGQAKAVSEEAAGDAVDARTLPVPNLDVFKVQKDLAEKEALKTAQMLGFGEAQTADMLKDTQTAIHAGVIDRFLAEGRTGEATRYFEAVGEDEINSDVRTKIARTLQTASVNDRAHDLSVEIIDQADEIARQAMRDQEPAPVSGSVIQAIQIDSAQLDADELRRSAFRILRDMKMPDAVRQATLQRLEQGIKQRKAEEAANDADVLQRSQLFLAQNPDQGVSQLPVADQVFLQQRGLWLDIGNFADNRYSDNPVANVQVLAMTDEQWLAIDSVAELERSMLRLNMPEPDRKIARAFWAAARKPAETPRDRVLTKAMRMKTLGQRFELLRADGKTQTDERKIFLMAEVTKKANRRVAEEEASPRGEPFGERLDEILEGAFIDTLVGLDPGGSSFTRFFTTEQLFLRRNLTAEELERSFRDITIRKGTDEVTQRLSVPVNDLIVRTLRAQGLAVSDRSILDHWVSLGRPETVEEAEGR